MNEKSHTCKSTRLMWKKRAKKKTKIWRTNRFDLDKRSSIDNDLYLGILLIFACLLIQIVLLLEKTNEKREKIYEIYFIVLKSWHNTHTQWNEPISFTCMYLVQIISANTLCEINFNAQIWYERLEIIEIWILLNSSQNKRKMKKLPGMNSEKNEKISKHESNFHKF